MTEINIFLWILVIPLLLLYFLYEIFDNEKNGKEKKKNDRYSFKNKLVSHIKYEKGLVEKDYLHDYNDLILNYITKAKKSIFVYNFFTEKKINKEKSTLLTMHYQNYFKKLEDFIFSSKIDYKRIYQTSKINSKKEYQKQVLKGLYKETLLHLKRTFKCVDDFFYIKYNGGWRYNFMLIDRKYLIIEHYQRDENDRLIPDQLFVYESLPNNKNDIVQKYYEYIENAENVHHIKKSYFDKLMSEIKKDKTKEKEEIDKKIKKSALLLEKWKMYVREIENIKPKSNQSDKLVRGIPILKDNTSFMEMRQKELEKKRGKGHA